MKDSPIKIAVLDDFQNIALQTTYRLRRTAWDWPNPNDVLFKKCPPALAVLPRGV